MQVCEFKAWFEGFTEDMTKLPTVKQWARIKARIEDIDGEPTTGRIFIDRYWQRYEPYWTWTNPPFVSTTWVGGTGGTQTATSNAYRDGSVQLAGTEAVLNACQAFTALGRAEAASVAA